MLFMLQVDVNGEVVRWYSHFSPFIAGKFRLLTKIVTHPFFRITMSKDTSDVLCMRIINISYYFTDVIVFTNLIYFYKLTTYVGSRG